MITQEDVRTYTEAQCWVLAWHLLQELPVEHEARIVDFDEHVLVQLGDADCYLDVTGISTKAELAKVWGEVHRMRPISYDLSQHILPDPEHPENSQARRVARVLVAGLERTP